MTKIEYININFDNNGIKLEKFILNKFKIYNYIFLQKLIRTGQIRVNKKRVKLGHTLKTGDVLRLPITEKSGYLTNKSLEDNKKCNNNNISLKEKLLIKFLINNILYQDEHIVAFNKPKELPIQGGKGIKTSLDRLLPYIKNAIDINYNGNLKIVHRLDRDTSGVILLAKTNTGAKFLFSQFKEQKIIKVYYCLVQGKVNKNGTINANLIKLNNQNNKSTIDKKGKKAITEYKVIAVSPENYSEKENTNKHYITFLKIAPKTGRNHQIRVHLSSVLNTPIIGDFKYGYKVLDLPFILTKNEIFLHAYSITFYNLENKEIEIIAPLNERWLDSLKKLSINFYK